jgi:glycosyltransferase involved in cell wall biosynthesis
VKLVLIVYNTAYYVHNFRRPLIRRLRFLGYDVHVAAPRDAYAALLESGEGVTFHDTALDGKGMDPPRDLAYLIGLARLYRQLKPYAVLHYTIKPNIYGSIAARIAGVPAINNVTGLGAAFSRDSILQRLVRVLYRLAFSRVELVFFQNPDDQELFLRLHLVRPEHCGLLPGSGVDTAYFSPRPRVGQPACTFLLAARLLAEKGVGDYAAAARIVKASRPEVRFLLAGEHDPEDAHMIRRAELDAWTEAGIVEWLGKVEDIRDAIAMADCVVLPSRYREGVPRSLLEAASMAKPLIASDWVGTREPVDEGVNGYLCRPGDPEDLARAMLSVASLPPGRLAMMGEASRKKMQDQFEEKIVLDAYEAALQGLES